MVDFVDLGFQALNAVLGQGERQQISIIKPKDIFLLHVLPSLHFSYYSEFIA